MGDMASDRRTRQVSRAETHRVPEGDPARWADAALPPARWAGRPSAAERARTQVAASATGALATLAREPAGHPFGSVVSYNPDDHGRPLLLLSDLAEHTRNLDRDPRASLLVTEEPPHGADPLAHGRVTLVGAVHPLPAEGQAGARDRYAAAHPHAGYASFQDFRVYRLEVAAIRWVGGFGRMDWVEPVDYATAEPDPLRQVAASAIAHMNDDHADVLRDYCRALGDLPDTVAAVLVAVHRYGLDLVADLGSGKCAVRIPFSEPLDDVEQLRSATIHLARQARATLHARVGVTDDAQPTDGSRSRADRGTGGQP